MDLGLYQQLARETAIYPSDYSIVYPALGLCGEAGEVAEKIKKTLRDGGGYPQEALKKELGDCLWYLAALAGDLDLSLNDIAKANLEKLKDRKERWKLQGSGDSR